MVAPNDTRRTWAAAVAVGWLSLILGFITLGTKPLWFDEAFNAQHIKQPWSRVLHAVGATEMSQGAYMAGLKVWAVITPDSEVWLRLPSVIFAALAAALLVPLGTRLFDRRTGIIAGVLLASNALVVRHEQEARTYALVTLAVVVASILFVRALDDPTRRRWLLYAVAAAVAVYCHFFAGLVIVAHLVSIPFAPVRPPPRRVVEAALLFVGLILVTLYFISRAGRDQLSWIRDPSIDVVVRAVRTALGQNLALGAAAFAGLTVLAVRAGAGNRVDRWRLVLIGAWCSLPIALALAVSVVQPILVPRYTIVITPAIALAAAFPIALALDRHRVIAVVGVGALTAVVALSGYRIVQWYQHVPEDWRAAAAYIQRERHQGDVVVVAPVWAADAFAYYDSRQRIDTAAGKGRTFMLLYSPSAEVRSNLASALAEKTGLELATEERFGSPLVVRLYAPRVESQP